MLALITVVVAVVLPRGARAAGRHTFPPARALSPFDPRLRRFLAVGFLLFLSLGTIGSTFIVGPLIGTALYAAGPALPVVLSGLLCLAAGALLVRPVRRTAPAAEVPVGD